MKDIHTLNNNNNNNKSSPKSFGKSMTLPVTAQNGLAHFVCY